jgi:hypothetical protein
MRTRSSRAWREALALSRLAAGIVGEGIGGR